MFSLPLGWQSIADEPGLRNSPTEVGSNRPEPAGSSAMIAYAVPGFT